MGHTTIAREIIPITNAAESQFMNKDALLATAIGFVIGLAITGILLVGPSVLQKLPKISFQMPTLPKSQQKQPNTTPTQDTQQLSIDSPLNEAIESEKELLISGKAKKGSTIVIQGILNETVVETSDDGAYAGKITLIEGKNDITVTSFAKEIHTAQTITIFYTPESL